MADSELTEDQRLLKAALLALKDVHTAWAVAVDAVDAVTASEWVEDADAEEMDNQVDEVAAGLGRVLGGLAVIAGRLALSELVAAEIAEVEAVSGPPDIRDKLARD